LDSKHGCKGGFLKALSTPTFVEISRLRGLAGYESDCGSKTTIRLLNSMWSNNYGIASKIKAYDLPLEPGVALIVSRGEAVNRNYLGVRVTAPPSPP
jgi:hypothetical protein